MHLTLRILVATLLVSFCLVPGSQKMAPVKLQGKRRTLYEAEFFRPFIPPRKNQVCLGHDRDDCEEMDTK